MKKKRGGITERQGVFIVETRMLQGVRRKVFDFATKRELNKVVMEDKDVEFLGIVNLSRKNALTMKVG